jgi:integrase
MKWTEEQKITNTDERVGLAYLQKMSEEYKPSTMWTIHSKLQSMLRVNKGVDIKSFVKVHAFMKAISKKAYVFNEDELRKFFIDAPDITYLFLKVVAICGIFGSCRCELCDLRLHDIKEEGSVLLITIRPSKTVKGRRFTIADSDGIRYVRFVKQYLSLRPQNVSTNRVSYGMIGGSAPIKWLVLIHLDHVPCKLHVILNWTILRNTRDMRFDVPLLPLWRIVA